MMGWKRVMPALAVLLIAAQGASAQDRGALIDEARVTFGDTAVIRLLHSAMSPALGGPDSLWATAGYELAMALLRTGQPDRAALWLRTIVRHAPGYPIDRINFPPIVVGAFDFAAQEVTADPATVTTAWQWPASLDPDTDGTVEVESNVTGLQATVESVGPIQPGGIMSLPPGTYTVTAAADDWEPVTVQREVLPGTALTLGFDLVPMLPAAAAAAAAAGVVTISYQRAGLSVCRSGYIASGDGLVLTSLDAVRDASGISVSASGGSRTYTDVTVIATDEARDLAVLRLPVDSTARMPAGTAAAGDYAWSIQSDACANQAVDRTRIDNASASAVALGIALPAAARGAPLVDRGGFLVGIVTGPTSALPDVFTRDLIERARAQIAVQIRPAPGGGFPWKWVGLGAVVAGVGVAVAGGGGGGDDGPPAATTGGIIITFPGS